MGNASTQRRRAELQPDTMDFAAHIAETEWPHSSEAEQAALGSVLAGRPWPQWLTPGDFYVAQHPPIAAAILALVEAGQAIDPISVHLELQRRQQDGEAGGLKYLNALHESGIGLSNVDVYAEKVRGLAQQRRNMQAADGLKNLARRLADPNEFGAAAQQLLESFARGSAPQASRLDHVTAASLDESAEQFDDELIEGTIGRAAMAVLYGDSNSGKTFCAIDMGAAVERGSHWLGRPTDRGLVVYLATESPTSVEMRLKAYQAYHQVRMPGFVIVRSPINLFDGKADTRAVISLVSEVERSLGGKVALIIGDTLARLVVGANENAGEDMGVVVRNIDAIRASTGAAFLCIHHTGKDAAKGMRGWSGLRAATDTEIEVKVDEATGLRTAEITKQRDLPGKGDRIGFRLVPVPLGFNRWGTERGSCVVEPADAPETHGRAKRRSEVAGAIEEFLRGHGTGCLKGAIAKHFEGHYVRTSVYRELSKMVDSGELIETAGLVALPGKPVSKRAERATA